MAFQLRQHVEYCNGEIGGWSMAFQLKILNYKLSIAIEKLVN